MNVVDEIKKSKLKSIDLVFPHQLFKDYSLSKTNPIFIIEEYLFFRQYKFHKQKLAFHRASMKAYEDRLRKKGRVVFYIDSIDELSDVRKLISFVSLQGVDRVTFINPVDNWLMRRIHSSCNLSKIQIDQKESPGFINTTDDLQEFFRTDKKKFFQTKWYIDQRKRRNVLLNKEGGPKGGKWSFDAENRKKYPKNKEAPVINFPEPTSFVQEAHAYVLRYFAANPGNLDSNYYPIDHSQSEKWLLQFFEIRFHDFGPYEDAIVEAEHFLNHSVLTPMLNTGLLTPQLIISKALAFAERQSIPINSLEGFVRQILGWREFIRGVYITKGSEERTRNFWNFKRKIPSGFYTGTTGIAPVDQTIKKLLKTGYNHHIERLMILGNFMFLCEFDPDEVYKWFMEMYIDAYDWVMVPNVYGMSQFADGGLMSTKPYFSGSNYVKKMSNYKNGKWQEIWDGLFWRFIDLHRDFFLKNPRLSMMVRLFDKMNEEKKIKHLENASTYLDSL